MMTIHDKPQDTLSSGHSTLCITLCGVFHGTLKPYWQGFFALLVNP